MSPPSKLLLDVEDEPTHADMKTLAWDLEAFNEKRWPAHQPWKPLAVFAREEDKIVGGLAGETYAGWLFIRYLFLSEGLRGQGVGRRLIAAAETRALERGAHSAFVDTFSFQAPGFYRKLGYETFAELDWSPDFKRHFLRKRLTEPAEGKPEREA